MKNRLSALSFLSIDRRLIGLLLLLFVVAGGAAAQQDSVLFFNEVDTVFQKVRVGREVDVTYYSTSEIRNLSLLLQLQQAKRAGKIQIYLCHENCSAGKPLY